MARADEELRGPIDAWPSASRSTKTTSAVRSLGVCRTTKSTRRSTCLAPPPLLAHARQPRGERALARRRARGTAGAQPSIARTRALSRWGELAERKGDYAAARGRYADALEMGVALGDAVRQGVALLSLGDIDLAQGRLDGARGHFEAAAAAMSEAGDPERARWPIDALGRLALAAGDTGRALSSSRRAAPMRAHSATRAGSPRRPCCSARRRTTTATTSRRAPSTRRASGCCGAAAIASPRPCA